MPGNDWASQANDIGGIQLLNQRPTPYIAESYSRAYGHGVFTPLSGYIYLTSLLFEKGQVVTNLGFWTGTTAAVTPTNWWVGLYAHSTPQQPGLTGAPTALTMLRQSADQTTGAIAASTEFTKAMSSTYTMPASGWYYHGLMIKATTMPTVVAANTAATVPAALLSKASILCAREGAGAYTTPASGPATLGALTATSQPFYVFAT